MRLVNTFIFASAATLAKMLSYVASLFQRSSAGDENEDSLPSEPLDHAVTKEAGDWLVISMSNESGEKQRQQENKDTKNKLHHYYNNK